MMAPTTTVPGVSLSGTLNPRQILVVDDDPVSLGYLRLALTKQGHAVVAAGSVAEAQAHVVAGGIASFQCVLTDYHMPDRSGLDLLAWIQSLDAALATVLVTAEQERALVTKSLRGGAVDFLDKPVSVDRLLDTVARAMEQTRRHRLQARSASDVRALARTQQQLLSGDTRGGRTAVDLCFHPRFQAGGDFFARFEPAPGQCFCLLTDVSGHDLQAAYLSSYFQGFVRGLVQHHVPVRTIFQDFNRFLLEEWNQPAESPLERPAQNFSVAACALWIDFERRSATVWNHGTPAPIYFSSESSGLGVGESGGAPLGWFDTLPSSAATQPVADGGAFYLWTDGLQDSADQKGASALSLAFALQAAHDLVQPPPALDSATDDILSVAVRLLPGPPDPSPLRPLVLERYGGGEGGRIDEYQAFWRRSLALALPRLPERTQHDVLLASREALLNALSHGCQGQPDRSAAFELCCSSDGRRVRVRVRDSGPGFAPEAPPSDPADERELRPGHRGLLLMRQLAHRYHLADHGATVTMDFEAS